MDIPLSSDALDLSFHPSDDTNLLAVGLISGKVQLINYDEYIASTSSSSSAPPPPPSKKIRTSTDPVVKRYAKVWNTRPSRKSCRGLHFDNEDGRGIYSISKDKSLFLTDTEAGKVRCGWLDSHESAPSRVLPIDPSMVVTGDDEGVVRVWDPRKPGGTAPKPVRQYDHHFDWITDMLYVPYLPEKRKTTQGDKKAKTKKEMQNKMKKDRKKARKAEYQRQAAAEQDDDDDDDDDDQTRNDDSDFDSEASDDDDHRRSSRPGGAVGRSRLVVTSGDGSLSSIDLRAAGPNAFEVSEDQEDELLCVTALKNTSKLVVGTQMGILSLWAPRRGLLDHVDRVPGHPASVDTLCMLDQDTVLTGSSDGLVRVVQILPSKLLGVIADHAGLPVERMKRKLATLATIGHSNSVKFTDLAPLLNDEDDDDDDHHSEHDSDSANDDGRYAPLGLVHLPSSHTSTTDDDDDDDEEEDEEGIAQEERELSDSNSDAGSESDDESDDDQPPPPPQKAAAQPTRRKPAPNMKSRNNHRDNAAFFDQL